MPPRRRAAVDAAAPEASPSPAAAEHHHQQQQQPTPLTDEKRKEVCFIVLGLFRKFYGVEADAIAMSKGLPLELLWTPCHLVPYEKLLSDDDVVPYIVRVQNDEKDIYRMTGRAGTVDDGSGQLQKEEKALDGALEALEGAITAIAGAKETHGPLAPGLYSIAHAPLPPRQPELNEMEQLVRACEARVKAKQAALKKKQSRSSVERESAARYIAFNESWLKHSTTWAARTSKWDASVEALPSPAAVTAGTATAPTYGDMDALLGEAAALLRAGFDLGHTAASKVLACIYCSCLRYPRAQ